MEKSGKGKDELLALLEKTENKYTAMGYPGQDVTLQCHFTDEGLREWRVRCVNQKRSDSPIVQKGKRYDTLFEALADLDKTKTVYEEDSYEFFVYCVKGTPQATKTQVLVELFLVDPVAPFIYEKGQPIFQTKKFHVQAWEWERIQETGIGFLEDDIIYPITKTAIPAVGTLLDCASAFKNVEHEYLLGSALLIAEKLSKLRGVQVVYRETTQKVRPIRSLLGKRYQHIPQKEFFREVFDRIAEKTAYTVEKWSITDQNTSVYIRFMDRWEGLLIENGDLLGQSMAITAFVKIDEHYIYIKRNKQVHSGKFHEGGMERLLHGIEEAFAEFDLIWEHIGEVTYRADMFEKIKKNIGVKRFRELDHADGEAVDGHQLIFEMLNNFDVQLNHKQTRKLRESFFEIIKEV